MNKKYIELLDRLSRIESEIYQAFDCVTDSDDLYAQFSHKKKGQIVVTSLEDDDLFCFVNLEHMISGLVEWEREEYPEESLEIAKELISIMDSSSKSLKKHFKI